MGDPKETVPPGEQTYPTPPLDPKTGAPIDTRFAPPAQEATAEQPSPKSEAAKPKQKEEADKSSESPRRRR